MPEPWSADRELDVRGVRLVMATQFPHFALESVEFLGSGWDYDAYLIDDDTVVRFPRRADVAARLEREEAILDFVGTALGASVRVPRIVLRGAEDAHFPHRFFGHASLPGLRADEPGAPASSDLAAQIGDALTRIHSIPAHRAEGAGIGREEEGCKDRLGETIRRVSAVPSVRDLVPEPLSWLERGPSPPPEYSGDPRFIHNDFCPDHIIVDRDEGRLVGIIDWSDAAVGDPALDFVELVLWRGWAFAESILEHYDMPAQDDFRVRLDFLARVLGLKWLADAIRREGDVDKHVGWVENAFTVRTRAVERS